MFYIYQHIDTNTGECRYIGKGRGFRAWTRAGRNQHWHRVFNKDNLTVELILEDLTEQEAFEKEIKHIALAKAAGSRLVNMTGGGEGSLQTEQTRVNKDSILTFYTLNNRMPSQHGEEEEYTLWVHLRNYTNPKCGTYDPEFSEWANPLKQGNHSSERKEEIKAYYEKHNKLPSKYTEDGRPLYQAFHHYIDPKDDSYDPEFEKWARPRMVNQVDLRKTKIVDFYLKNGRLPNRKIKEEKSLLSNLYNYINEKNPAYDPTLREWFNSVSTAKHRIKKLLQ